MSSLDNQKKALLLELARRAITEASSGREAETQVPTELAALQCAGAFVTLHRNGKLRGCMGQIALAQPAADLIDFSAKAAATHDPRFRPVQAEELADIEIEISLLSAPEATEPHKIEPGQHGLVVSRGFQRGLLLPQVATEHGWGRVRFLEETCLKAGLERNAWMDPETQIFAFTAAVFSESEISGARSPANPATLNPNYSSST